MKVWCPLQGRLATEEECVTACAAPEQRVVCQMEAQMNQCIDCGKEVTGLRCRQCNGLFIQRQHAAEQAEGDTAILSMRDVEHLSYRRIADRIGVSPARAKTRLQDARRREQVRAGMA
jgi:hypothetical protein